MENGSLWWEYGSFWWEHESFWWNMGGSGGCEHGRIDTRNKGEHRVFTDVDNETDPPTTQDLLEIWSRRRLLYAMLQ